MANKLLDNELESSIVQLLFDPQIRQFCGPFLESWMFQRTIYSRLVETLINKDFRDHSVDLKVVKLYMQQNYKDVYSEDWKTIEDAWLKFSPLGSSNDVESVTKMITNFIKNRMCLKGVDLYAKGDTKTAEDYFSRAGSFNISPDPFINPLQEGIVEYLRQKDLPTGGRVIKSSLGLVNTALQYGGYKTGDLIMVVMKPKSGKCCKKATPIIMFDGTIKKVEDIRVGDLLMGQDSTPRTVLSVCSGVDDLYEITPNKGDSYVVNESHILSLIDTRTAYRPIININVRDFLNESATFRKRAKGWRTGVFFPKHSDNNPLVITPYFLGLWLGDGTSAETSICTADVEIREYVYSFAKGLDLEIRESQKDNNNKATMLYIHGTKGRAHVLLDEFRRYGLIENKTKEIKNERENVTGYSGITLNKVTGKFETQIQVNGERVWLGAYDTAEEAHLVYVSAKVERYRSMGENCLTFKGKHIPHRYKTGSVEERLELLAGIIDTDGYLSIKETGRCFDIILKNETLLDDIMFVARSLGFSCYKKECSKTCMNNGVVGTYYRCLINGPIEKIPTKIVRKKAEPKTTDRDRNHLVTGISVSKKGKGEYFGFELDGDGLFLLGDFTVTHNSTLMIQEAASAADQGFKVAHMFFGDFSEFDGICKFMSCVTGDLISNVVNAPELYKKRCESWLKNWRVASFPAFSLDCNEIVSYAKNLRKKFPFDFLILDYDSNIRNPQDAGMYESGGVVYSTFKGFGQQEGHVSMIGSQPKIQFWKDEVLDYACAAESSRKQHVVDVMLTGGRNDVYKGIGTIHLPLIRRGESAGITRIRFDDRNSRMREITQLEYDNLLREHKNLQHQKDSGSDFTLQGVVFKDKPSSEQLPEIVNVS